MRVWPYSPQQGLRESFEWLTDVIRCVAGEDRVALRHLPRQSFNMTCWLSPQEYGAAKVFARSEESEFLIPAWPYLVDIPDRVLGDDFLPGVFDPRLFGRQVLLWQSNSVWQLVDVEHEPGGLRLATPLDRAFFHPCVLPVMPVTWAQAPDFTVSNNDVRPVNIMVTTVYGHQLAVAKSFPLYRGLHVLTDDNILLSQLKETHWHEKEEVDSQSGVVTVFNAFRDPQTSTTMSWHPLDKPELMNTLEWIHSRQGRRHPFWYRSHNMDLTPRGPYEQHSTAGKGSLVVTLVDGLAEAAPFDIMIERRNGTSVFARVERVEFVSDQVRALVLSARPASPWPQAEIARVSFLVGVRFDADRVELNHKAGGAATVAVPIVEVPNL